MSKFPRRFLICIFWVGIIFAALYLPHLKFFSSQELNIFAWGDILDPTVIAEFEQKTGIKINMSYYSSNEELIVKLRATRGKGYDLIIPSDYTVSILSQEGLLKPLDRSKLHFWEELNPLLLGHLFDPNNRYSIPFAWELYGIGVNKNYFLDKPFAPSWQLIFENQGYKIAMVNDPIQAVLIADLYLYGQVAPLTKEQLLKVKQLLVKQKEWVEAYADFRADYFLATGSCPVALASSSYIWRTKKMFPFVEFVVPKEGTFITIENLCIPSQSEKESLAYQFINALFTPSSLNQHLQTYGIFPAALPLATSIQMDPAIKELFQSSKEDFQHYHFSRQVAAPQEILDLWVELKS